MDELSPNLTPEQAAEFLRRQAMPMGLMSGMAAPPMVGPQPAPFVDEMSPNERAAQRLRAPYADRVPLPQGPPELTSGPDMAMAAAGMALPGVFSMAPKIAIPALTAYLYGQGADPAGAQAPQGPEAVKALQKKLQAEGLYSGDIDGNFGPGTRRAQEALTQRDLAKAKQDEVAASRAASEATIAQAKQKEADRKYKQEGSARLQTVESDVPWYSKALRDYATPAGVVGGMLLGSGVRAGVTAAANRASANTARKAEEIFAEKASGVPGRAARVNEFWRQGGAKPGEVPFLTTPGAPGMTPNPAAPPVGSLYAPSTGKNLATDLGIAGMAGGESAYGQFVMTPAAQERMQRATAAAAEDPSEVNIRELQAAKDNLAMAEVITNLGRGTAGGYLGSSIKMKRTPTAPRMNKAESEQVMIGNLLRKQAAKAAD